MKKIYTNPDIDVKEFASENIVTSSGAKAGDLMSKSFEEELAGRFKRISISDMNDMKDILVF